MRRFDNVIMNISESIRMAFSSVRMNMLRSILTLLIIAVGITALVGILTAIDALLFTMTDNFSRMGANSFNISPSGRSFASHQDGRQQKRGANITFRQAMEFKERYDFAAAVTVSGRATGNAMIKYANEKTNPTVMVYGIDESYIPVLGYEIETGRDFTSNELEHGSNKAIIGMEIVNILFDKKPERALNSVISIGNIKFRVVGVLQSKGASMNQSADRRVFIPLLAEKNYYGYTDKNYEIAVGVESATELDEAMSTAISVMRPIRKLKASEENDFEMFKSESLLEILKENTVKIRMATITIGLITLLGAAIGLMNIMLVSVTERTREIGITKALGATRRNIMTQFLIEAIIICQMGGIVGILLGIGIGNLVAQLVGGKFLIPWGWMLLGIVTCMIVGLISGLYPALKAARLDPIQALHHE